MKDDILYIIICGFVDEEPIIRGVFNDLKKAKDFLIGDIRNFIEANMLGKDAIIEKNVTEDHTFFYIYQDAEEKNILSYSAVYTLATITPGCHIDMREKNEGTFQYSTIS